MQVLRGISRLAICLNSEQRFGPVSQWMSGLALMVTPAHDRSRMDHQVEGGKWLSRHEIWMVTRNAMWAHSYVSRWS